MTHKLQFVGTDGKWVEYECPICGYHTFRNQCVLPGEKRANVLEMGDINAGHIISEGLLAMDAGDLEADGDIACGSLL